MRNPINAIHCQNYNLQDLLDQLEKVIRQEDNKPLGSVKRELIRIRNDMKMSLEV